MTANVIKALEKIKYSALFDDELFFVGGTALSYYINHRISEDIDIVSAQTLNYKTIIPMISSLGAVKIQDENITALRMVGLFPDEYMLKFIIDNVKLEFFQANRPIQKEIFQTATFTTYKDSKIKILDLKSICKLKLVVMCQPYFILIHKHSKLLFQLVTSFFLQTPQVINYHLQNAFSVYCNKLQYTQI